MVSMAAFRSVPLVPGYALGEGRARGADREPGPASGPPTAIRVNAVAPGVIETPMTAPIAALPELRDAELAHTPMGRFGTPDEVVAASRCSWPARPPATSPATPSPSTAAT